MKTIFRFLGVLLLLASVFTGSCKKKTNNNLDSGIPVFYIDTFVKKVSQLLNISSNAISGYQFVVTRTGQLYHRESAGFLRHRLDRNGPVWFTDNSRMNVASVSKFIGAICIEQLADKHGFSIDDGIADFLPASWKDTMHADFKNKSSKEYLTFKKILTMQSSVSFPGSSPPSGDMLTAMQMKQGLAAAPDSKRIGIYQNGNFNLIRILVGEIEYKLNEKMLNYDSICAEKYLEYVRNHIFQQAGINPPGTLTQLNNFYAGSSYAYAYQYPFDSTFKDGNNAIGWDATNDALTSTGSGGFILSATDLGAVLSYLIHDPSHSILSKNRVNEMLENELGLTESVSGKYGNYRAKQGTRGPDGNQRALRSCIMIFPNNIEAVIITNSNYSAIGNILKLAYDYSWK